MVATAQRQTNLTPRRQGHRRDGLPSGDPWCGPGIWQEMAIAGLKPTPGGKVREGKWGGVGPDHEPLMEGWGGMEGLVSVILGGGMSLRCHPPGLRTKTSQTSQI